MKMRMKASRRSSGGLPRDAMRSTQATNPMQKGATNMGKQGMIRVPYTRSSGRSGRKG